ncbi:hypothetical protein [Paenibacillus macerans]|uniref:hypothetical protein n=1 Tax=Paenibacillus macerans TaxID=44252 RepID=UPI0022E7564C|nr:hypothetical protein [Paenibacillus macerans]
MGVVTLQQNEQTLAMYHEYTGVLRDTADAGLHSPSRCLASKRHAPARFPI